MNLRKVLSFGIALVIGAVMGFVASWVIQVQGEKAIAKAHIYVAGEALRSGDLVTSMIHAQSIIAHAPDAYDGYEFAGDIYSKQGYTVGAKKMYELALEKLDSRGTEALLVQEGANSVATAAQMLKRKITSLESGPAA
jgi:Tfp pilus assembly protein PilF